MFRQFCLALVLLAAVVIGGTDTVLAQAGKQDRGAPKPGATQTTPAAPATPSAPQRTETITYDAWTVNCHEIIGSSAKKTCSAITQLIEQSRRQVVLSWLIGTDKDGRLTSVFKAPTGIVRKHDSGTTTGLLLKNGLELKLGNGAVRHLAYLSCDPQWCDAVTPMDEAFIREATAAPAATVTVYTPDGQAFSFPELTLKGIDKAVSSVRR